jgi:hypothetical protein
MRRSGILGIYAVHYVVNGLVLLAAPTRFFAADSYRWILYFMPIRAWGLIFLAVGLFASWVAIEGRHGRALAHGYAAVSLLAFWWAVGLAVAAFTGHLENGVAPIAWSLISWIAAYSAGLKLKG